MQGGRAIRGIKTAAGLARSDHQRRDTPHQLSCSSSEIHLSKQRNTFSNKDKCSFKKQGNTELRALGGKPHAKVKLVYKYSFQRLFQEAIAEV